MKRENKYPYTDTFRFYNANPTKKFTSDCVVRAISKALNQGYFRTVNDLFNTYIQTGYHIADKKCFEKYLDSIGLAKQKQPRKADNTKYTGEEFCKEIASSDFNYIVMIGVHHITAICNNKINDTWDCTDKTVGNYWIIKK